MAIECAVATQRRTVLVTIQKPSLRIYTLKLYIRSVQFEQQTTLYNLHHEHNIQCLCIFLLYPHP